MSQFGSLAKRYWLAFYWLIFACLAAVWGQNPGLLPRSQPLPPYPWTGVVITWIILAVEICVFYKIVYRPKNEKRPQWQRLRDALFYLFGLCVFEVFIGVTDMPGYAYVNLYFAATSFAILCVIAVALGLTKLWGRLRHAP